MKGQGNNNSQRQDSLPTASRLTPEEEAMFAGAPPKVKGYNIISALGEGGFGIVYLAEQQKPVRRRVALKVIKPGMDSKRVIARFEAEEQALALLDHTNVAQIYEAGMTETGQSYFAMEYVKGVPITEYCDRERLSIEERLGLFIQVCDAIGHAHQKGIIHRDIKPSNILICLQDEKTIPKVIDFGVAKAISQPLTERTLFTEQGQLVGTPAYMSPEQAEVTAQDVDTRTDIYSLGVLLYELLTGVLPFDPKTLREAAFSKIQRIIREQDPP
ncbi:MAG: serine/threonine protein kinase, partial [Planctomycetota bacterium]